MVVLSEIKIEDEVLRENKEDILFFDPENLKEVKALDRSRVEVLFINQPYVNRAFLQLFPEVKWIQIPSSGYDQVDLKVLKERNIIFTNGRGAYSTAIAEDIFSKMLTLARNIDVYVKNQEQRKWDKSNIETFELKGKTLGILGAGSIGRETAGRAKCFGMKTMGMNTTGDSVPGFDKVYTVDSMDILLKKSDFVVSALPLNNETDGLIDQSVFSCMKKSSYFINVGRGPVVVEDDLIQALKEKQIAGAALDVFAEEPLDGSSPLWQLPDVYITPHQAGRSDHSRDRAKGIFIHNLAAYPNTEKMKNVIIK